MSASVTSTRRTRNYPRLARRELWLDAVVGRRGRFLRIRVARGRWTPRRTGMRAPSRSTRKRLRRRTGSRRSRMRGGGEAARPPWRLFARPAGCGDEHQATRKLPKFSSSRDPGNLTPGDPSKLRCCPNVAEQMPKMLGKLLREPSFARARRILADSGHALPNFG